MWKRVYLTAAIASLFWATVAMHDVTLAIWRGLAQVSWTILAGSAAAFIVILFLVWATRSARGVFSARIGKANLNHLVLFHPRLRYITIPLVLWNLPLIAAIEEYVFRHGFGIWPTLSWPDAAWRSIAFGLMHLLGGVSLRVCLIMWIGGMWLSRCYFSGGFFLATEAHLIYDLIVLGAMFGSLVLKRYRSRRGATA